MTSRQTLATLLIVSSIAAATPVRGQSASDQFQPTPPPTGSSQAASPEYADSNIQDRVPIGLHALVVAALGRNLELRGRRIANRIVATDIQAQRSAFDPAIEVEPSLTGGNRTFFFGPAMVPPNGGPLDGGTTVTTLDASLAGTLPFSTEYFAALDTARQDQFDYVTGDTTFSAGLSQPLLRGRGSSIAQAGVELAALVADSSDERLTRLIEEVAGAVETAYWSLGAAEQVEETALRSVSRARELVSRNEQLRDLRLVAEVDVVTARSGLAIRQTALTVAIRDRRDAAQRLLYLVYGEDTATQLAAFGLDFRTEPPRDATPDATAMARLAAEALGARHDVRAAAFAVRAAEVSRRVADNGRLPELDLFGSYTALNDDAEFGRLLGTGRLGDNSFDGFTAGVSLTYPIGNNSAEAAYAEADLAVARRQVALAAAENTVRSEVQEAARAVTSGVEQLALARQSLQLMEQRYENGRGQLRLGLIDSFRLLQIEESVSDAELVELRARYQLANAITRYEVATGRVDDKYIPGGAAISPR